jgi:hypothetical protein
MIVSFGNSRYRGTRALIYHAGKVISERQAKRKFGTCGRRALAKLGICSYLVPRRSRYFAFRGNRREQAALRAAIINRLLPYPKRQQQRMRDGLPGLRMLADMGRA